MADPITESARALDLSSRLVDSTVVVASPALAAETVIAQVQVPGGLTYAAGVRLVGWAAFTVGTSGTTVQLRIRRGTVAGTVVANSGACNDAAGVVDERNVHGFDAGAADGQVYVLTMQVANGAAASTVSAVELAALAI